MNDLNILRLDSNAANGEGMIADKGAMAEEFKRFQ